MRTNFRLRHGRWLGAVSVTLWLLLLGNTVGAKVASPPAVVVSIKPLHAIVSSVTQGVVQPALLIEGAGSPHGFALKPSQARLLQHADAIFWVGPALEQFLVKPLRTLPKTAAIIALSQEVELLPYRADGVWNNGDHPRTHDQNAQGLHESHSTYDPHFWLDPLRVQAIVPKIVQTLSDIDHPNAERYLANGEKLSRRLRDLNDRLQARLLPVRERPYLVYHDAYQYFEKRFALRAVGAVALDPEHRPGARHLGEIYRRLRRGDIRCIFREPQFNPPMLRPGSEFGKLRVAVLDPLGARIKAGSRAYFKMLENLAESMVSCLGVKDN